jgi:hypothetical protein
LIIDSRKAGRQTSSRWKHHGNFESRSHLLAANKPVNRGIKAAPCFGIGKFCDRFGSLGNANGLQKITLRYRPNKAGTIIYCGLA